MLTVIEHMKMKYSRCCNRQRNCKVFPSVTVKSMLGNGGWERKANWHMSDLNESATEKIVKLKPTVQPLPLPPWMMMMIMTYPWYGLGLRGSGIGWCKAIHIHHHHHQSQSHHHHHPKSNRPRIGPTV